MKRAVGLVVVCLVCAGCASVNDSIVRMYFQDQALGDQVNSQIRKGLKKRMDAPRKETPRILAPEFLDQG